eukprot:TRINITY_DN1734_c0_g1_i1.p1 TRINITY_DN1734_c0_g1~~TRINITY_DN1734_c0_g1_i1.p1  ORF type:complete len:157 (+),score=25.46 TRINITY_DN1734_c0_g1_i1:97-567(+)
MPDGSRVCLQKRIPIIPIRVEAAYDADGWLGALLGTKLWYDFSTKPAFTRSKKAFSAELNAMFKARHPKAAPKPSPSRKKASAPAEESEDDEPTVKTVSIRKTKLRGKDLGFCLQQFGLTSHASMFKKPERGRKRCSPTWAARREHRGAEKKTTRL